MNNNDVSNKDEQNVSFIYHPLFGLSLIGLLLFGCFFVGYSEAGLNASRALLSAGASLVASCLTIYALTSFNMPKSVYAVTLFILVLAAWFFTKLFLNGG